MTRPWNLFKTVFLQELKCDLVLPSGAACFILSHRRQCGGWGWGGCGVAWRWDHTNKNMAPVGPQWEKECAGWQAISARPFRSAGAGQEIQIAKYLQCWDLSVCLLWIVQWWDDVNLLCHLWVFNRVGKRPKLATDLAYDKLTKYFNSPLVTETKPVKISSEN